MLGAPKTDICPHRYSLKFYFGISRFRMSAAIRAILDPLQGPEAKWKSFYDFGQAPSARRRSTNCPR